LPVPSGTNARQSRQCKHVLEIELIPGRFNKADFQGNDFHSQLVLQAQTSKDVTKSTGTSSSPQMADAAAFFTFTQEQIMHVAGATPQSVAEDRTQGKL
jgi:hypothetical protein